MRHKLQLFTALGLLLALVLTGIIASTQGDDNAFAMPYPNYWIHERSCHGDDWGTWCALAQQRDLVDTCALALADTEGLAPLLPNDSRSLYKLQHARQAVIDSLQKPADVEEEATAYDNLWDFYQEKAIETDFDGLQSLIVEAPSAPTKLADYPFRDGRTMAQDIEEAMADCPENGYKMEVTKELLDSVPEEWQEAMPQEWWNEIYQAAPEGEE